ncbi:MAG: hypothetical protein AB7G93_03680 [Bdellovibrionales bacterium]
MKILAVSLIALTTLGGCKTVGSRYPASTLASGTSQNCEFCSWIASQDSRERLNLPVDHEQFCADAYAELGTPDRTAEYLVLEKELKDEIKSAKSAMNAAYANEFGEYDVTEVIGEEFRRAGLTSNKEKLKSFIESKLYDEDGDTAKFSSSAKSYCDDEMGSWYIELHRAKNKDSHIDEHRRRREKFKERWTREFRELARTSPIAFLEQVALTCLTLKSAAEKNHREATDSLAKTHAQYLRELSQSPACQQPLALKQMAAEVIRRESVEWTSEEAPRFVDPFLPVLFPTPTLAALEIKGKDKEGIGPRTLEFLVEQERLGSTCKALETFASTRADELIVEVQNNMAVSHVYLKKAMDRYYPPHRKDTLKTAFEWARKGVDAGLEYLTTDASTLAEMRESIAKIELAWPDPARWTIKEATHWSGKTYPVIDELAIPASDDYWYFKQILGSPVLDAIFVPLEPRRVYVYGAVPWMSSKLPMAIIELLGHEIGHDIDPIRAHNPKLSESVFGAGLTCMADRQSIVLQKEQWPEAAADVVSMVAVTHLLSLLPEEIRLSFAAQSLMTYSLIGLNRTKFQFRESHPFLPLRTSGILASSSPLRKVLKCEGIESRYATCF